MARIKLEPLSSYSFSCNITVRIDDINYGNHLSNDAYLKYMHEARLQFFASMGYSEMNLAGTSVIMGDTAIVFKAECFYGDELTVEVGVADIGVRSFDLCYRISNFKTQQLVALAKIGMVCFDYDTHKSTQVPQAFIDKFNLGL